MEFSVNEKAEAIDSVGHWARCTIREIRDGQYYVSFDGWSKAWNRTVHRGEIRPLTAVEIGRRIPSQQKRAAQVKSLHLEKGDEIAYRRSDGTIVEAVVSQCDPFNNTLVVLCEGDRVTLSPTDVVQGKPEQAKAEKVPCNPPKRSRPNKPAPQLRPPPVQQTADQVANTNRTDGVPLDIPVVPAARGYVSVGDVCTYENVLTVLVTSITSVDRVITVVCRVCKTANDQIVDLSPRCELHCPPTDLYPCALKPSSKVMRLVRSIVLDGISRNNLCVIDHGHDPVYQALLRKYMVGKFICHHVVNTLSGKAFKHTFHLVTEHHDLMMFGLNSENHFDITYLVEEGFDALDNLFHSEWDVKHDVSDPTSKFTFVRSIRFKASLSTLNVTVVKCISTEPFSKDYRKSACTMLASLQHVSRCSQPTVSSSTT